MKKRILIVFALIATTLVLTSTAYANSAAPIDLEIEINNLPDGALVDILVNELEVEFSDKNDEYIDAHHIDCETSVLYNYSEDGYLALKIREDSIFDNNRSAVDFNISFWQHAPNGFKVIVETKDNEVVVSDYIKYSGSNKKYVYDYEKNKIKSKRKPSYGGAIILALLGVLIIPLAMTLVIEVIVALIMKIKRIGVVIGTNIGTNLIMNLALLSAIFGIGGNYIITLIVLEVLVFIIEFLIYKKVFKENYTTKKIIVYTLVANLASLFVPIVLLGMMR